VNDVAAQWLRQYEEDNPAYLKELINLVLKSSGCDFQVSEDDINDPDNVPSRLNDLQEEYKGVRRSNTISVCRR
jgi:cohesin complex subunit SA-1/2